MGACSHPPLFPPSPPFISLPFLPSPPFPYPSSSLPLLFSPSLPLEVGPLNTARGSEGAVSSPSGVWGGAPAEIEFGAF